MTPKRRIIKLISLFSKAGLIIFFVINTAIVVSVQAETFCVSNSAELRTALTSVMSNGEDDTIQVVQGVYETMGSEFYYFTWEDFDLSLLGGYTPGCTSRVLNPKNTILDGQGSSRVIFLFPANDTSGSIHFQGFTVRNGHATGWERAGGLEIGSSVGHSGNVTVDHNIITDNFSEFFGAGISGGSHSGVTRIDNNMIINNTSEIAQGGGSILSSDGTAYITNNTISGNTAPEDGGLRLWANGTATMRNNIFYGNTAPDLILATNNIVLVNNVIGIQSGTSGVGSSGNLNVNPLFIGNGDFHLKRGSPCIDSGDNQAPLLSTYDFEGHPRIFDGDGNGTATVDIGADEYIIPPIDAEFSASLTRGVAPLTVNFTDQSTGTVDSWNWSFGDGSTSNEQNPSHTYKDLGSYTVTLTVTGPTGSNTETKSDYIKVSHTKAMPWMPLLLFEEESTIANEPNIVFVTSTVYDGNLGGLVGADQKCQALAVAAGLPINTYIAWLSTSAVNAIDRLGGARGWVRVDGKPFADTKADISIGKIFYPIRVNELGHYDNSLRAVWTGTTGEGTLNHWGYTCSDWEVSSPGDYSNNGSIGYSDSTDGMFTFIGYGFCFDARPLYCFGVNNKVRVDVTPVVGRIAFMTKNKWIPGGGVASADQKCMDEAQAAGLSGTFKALLATEGANAASRFNVSGQPWVRRDGVAIAPTAADLFSADFLDSSINQSADGLLYFGSDHAITGAATPTTAGTLETTCNNWTSSSDAIRAIGGIACSTAQSKFFGGITSLNVNCSGTYWHLYCLQE